jgi:hypothetical protein
MESLACGGCGETLFDHQFTSSRKQSNDAFCHVPKLLIGGGV